MVVTGFVAGIPGIEFTPFGAGLRVLTGGTQVAVSLLNGDTDPDHLVRNFINGPSSTVGEGLALVGDADFSYDDETGLVVAESSSTGYGRRGTTYGSVYVTGDARYDDRLLRHEAVHADQYARYGGGLVFPALYLYEEYVGSDGGADNRYEREADLEDGCYIPDRDTCR